MNGKRAKSGQMSLPFHWIYVLIAGAVILLFFGGIIAKQKVSSEKSLAATVVTKLDNIFTGASLSEQTINIIDLPELDIYFICDKEGYSAYKVGESGPAVEEPYTPIFAPSRMETNQIVTWALDFSMPFHVTNLLMVGSDSTDYIVIPDSRITLELPEQLNVKEQSIDYLRDYEPTGNSVRIITTYNPEDILLSSAITDLPDQSVIAVRVTSNKEFATYYIKNGDSFVPNGDLEEGYGARYATAEIIPDFGGRDAGFYAALFSSDAEAYRCGMSKVFKRLGMLADVYHIRTKQIALRYQDLGSLSCSLIPSINLKTGTTHFSEMKYHAEECSRAATATCISDIYSTAQLIREDNTNMRNFNCAGLY